MPIFQQTVRWVRQPPYATGVNWANPLAAGIVWGYLPGCAVDVAKNRMSKLAGSAMSMTPYPTGKSLEFNQTGAVYFGRDAALEPTAVTMLGYLVGSFSQGLYARPIGKTHSNGGSAPYLSFDIEYNPGSAGYDVCSANVTVGGSIVSTTVVSSLPVLAPHTAGVAYANDGAGVQFFFNGTVRQTAGGSGAITYDASSTGDMIVGGATNAGAGNFSGNVFCAFVWNRRLSVAEVAAFNANPWQLFAP